MNQWEQGHYRALVDDTEATALSLRGGARPTDDDAKARAFNAKGLSGRPCSAVRTLTSLSLKHI